MPNQVIHFGIDDSRRLIVLEKSGYTINSCGISLPSLEEFLRGQSSIDAVVLSGIPPAPANQAVELVKSITSAPVVLFPDPGVTYDESAFDLVVPPLTLPPDWLRRMEELISKCRLLREQHREIQQRSLKLHESVTAAVVESRAQRKRTARLLEESRHCLENLDTDKNK